MLTNLSTGRTLAGRLTLCDTFLRRGRGLMFRAPLAPDQAYLFVQKSESRLDSAIHMFFVFFPIAVIWLDSQRRVVDQTLARPFRPYYAPTAPARYFVEAHPDLLAQVHPGDRLSWEGQP